MIAYHQSDVRFPRFDLGKARVGHFGVGIYFYLKKPENAHYAFCDVKLQNPIRGGERKISPQTWEEWKHRVEEMIEEESGERISIPTLGGTDIQNHKWLCDVYAGNVDHPNWESYLSQFAAVCGCDGYLEEGKDGFAMSFCPEKVAIICWF